MKHFSVPFILVSPVFITISCFLINEDILFYNITVIAEENINNSVDFDIINVNIYNLVGGLQKNYTGIIIKQQPIYDIQEGAVVDLPWLKYVCFDDNEIEDIKTGAFYNLPSLKELSITGNPSLKSIDKGVFQCSGLRELYLYNNSIQHIHSNAFAEVPQLRILGLDFNKIKRINHKWFVPTKYLFIIFLNHNKLSKIRESDLRSLRDADNNGLKLHLAENKIRTLEEGAFRRMFIDDINLASNNLKYLNDGVFEDASKLRHINFTGNEIRCTDRNQLVLLFSYIESITKNDGWDQSCIPIIEQDS